MHLVTEITGKSKNLIFSETAGKPHKWQSHVVFLQLGCIVQDNEVCSFDKKNPQFERDLTFISLLHGIQIGKSSERLRKFSD